MKRIPSNPEDPRPKCFGNIQLGNTFCEECHIQEECTIRLQQKVQELREGKYIDNEQLDLTISMAEKSLKGKLKGGMDEDRAIKLTSLVYMLPEKVLRDLLTKNK